MFKNKILTSWPPGWLVRSKISPPNKILKDSSFHCTPTTSHYSQIRLDSFDHHHHHHLLFLLINKKQQSLRYFKAYFLFSPNHNSNTLIYLNNFFQINLMEGLTSSRIIHMRAYGNQGNTCLFPTYTSNRRRVFFGPIRMMGPSTSSNSKAGSVKPITVSSLGRFDNTLPSKEVLDLWQKADAVCFDVDSTVCVDEGIDELAEFCGAGKAVAEWTARAMGGSVPFEEALSARLNLFKPSLSQVQEFLEKNPPRLSPGIKELVQKLKESGKTVYLISGGFRQMINPVALILGVPTANIFANQLLFNTSGEFAGFDVNEPTSRSGGKPIAVELIRKLHGYKTVVMIGDGATDLEARKPGCADLFICYGGVQLREAVSAKADWLVFNFNDLINSLE